MKSMIEQEEHTHQLCEGFDFPRRDLEAMWGVGTGELIRLQLLEHWDIDVCQLGKGMGQEWI